ncbi:MAG: ABC transporter ATP-binding protein [Candidatus Omnitrophica bacterium]|nr:ABC transporter ATP-binding protein [Candidatus Omnitrophota bacterium]
MIFLQVKDIDSGYNDKAVIHSMSFNLDRGEFVGIIGPNGSGKTTLLRTISHIIKPFKGTVLLESQNIHRLSKNVLARRIALAGQNILSVFSFTVEEIVLMGRNPYIGFFGHEKKGDLQKVRLVLEQTGLTRVRNKPVHCLSAGEGQRVLIARALAQEAKLLLLDEPTAHLDIGYQTDILDLIKSLQQESGISVICVLHDLNLASQYCDKLLLIDEGRAAGFDIPERVLKRGVLESVFHAACLVNNTILPGRPLIVPFSRRAR